MISRLVAIGALGGQFGLCRMDKHNSFRRHVGTLQIQHIPLANILDLARLALRILKHPLPFTS